MKESPFKNISRNDMPFWTRGEFTLQNRNLLAKNFIGKEVDFLDYIDQRSDKNFQEFIDPNETYGFSIERIQKCACGISALHMILRTLSQRYIASNKTVGELALIGMSFHRNDLIEQDKIIKVGTPVLKNPHGWYHDALIYIAKQNGVDGVRYENISLENLSGELNNLQSQGCDALAIVSVKDTYKLGSPHNTSHLIIINGIEVKDGSVNKIRVVDSNPQRGELIINEWVDVTSWVRNSYFNKAMIFYK
jgi:hypothetical protein